MKGLPICFSEVQVKNDVTDNNKKHFVTAFEGECRNIIELREHLKLCFLIILLGNREMDGLFNLILMIGKKVIYQNRGTRNMYSIRHFERVLE